MTQKEFFQLPCGHEICFLAFLVDLYTWNKNFELNHWSYWLCMTPLLWIFDNCQIAHFQENQRREKLFVYMPIFSPFTGAKSQKKIESCFLKCDPKTPCSESPNIPVPEFLCSMWNGLSQYLLGAKARESVFSKRFQVIQSILKFEKHWSPIYKWCQRVAGRAVTHVVLFFASDSLWTWITYR